MPKFAQKWNLGSKFQKSKSEFGINTSNISCMSIFRENGQLLIFWSKFGETAKLGAIFWSQYCWGCCRKLCGDWKKLGGGEWSWVEVEMSWLELDEAGWSWVELGARFSNTQISADEKDGDLLRFLWFKNLFNAKQVELCKYRFTRVMFEANCSRFLLNAKI